MLIDEVDDEEVVTLDVTVEVVVDDDDEPLDEPEFLDNDVTPLVQQVVLDIDEVDDEEPVDFEVILVFVDELDEFENVFNTTQVVQLAFM